MISHTKRLYTWMGSALYSPYAEPILAFLFYLEAICFLPTDPILILFCLERPNQSLRYAAIATIGSVLGGMTSYGIGLCIWQFVGETIIHNSWVNTFLKPETFQAISEQYQRHEWGAVLAAGFTPIPYKTAALVAGFCKVAFLPFILASVISRGARFFLYAFIITWCGVHIKQAVESYFTYIMIGSLCITVVSVWFLKW